jgi:hypothetical protein
MPNLTTIRMKIGVLMQAITLKVPSKTQSRMEVAHLMVMNKMMTMIKVAKTSLVTVVR